MSQELNTPPKKRGRPPMVPKIPVISVVEKSMLTEPRAGHDFTGLTSVTCCGACTPESGCYLSYGCICIHPHKGGMQPKHQTEPKTLARFEAAKKWLKGLRRD